MNPILTLVDRVEIVTGWDADLETEIFRALCIPIETVPRRLCEVTKSIDAVEALRASILPGSEIAVSGANNFAVTVWTGPADDQQDFGGHATTEPRARLAAVLRAIAGGVER